MIVMVIVMMGVMKMTMVIEKLTMMMMIVNKPGTVLLDGSRPSKAFQPMKG